MFQRIKEKFEDLKYQLAIKAMLTRAEAEAAKDRVQTFSKDNRGIAIIEIILILVVVMALVVVFREKLIELFNNIFNDITNNRNKIVKPY